jgi:hypothetical protein
MTAFEDAAWRGSVRMCQILLDWPQFQFRIDHANRHQQTALHYAAAAGHIRTVGKLLLERGATFYFYQGEHPSVGRGWHPRMRNDPLRLLCMQFNYGDARWLLNFCRQLYRNQDYDPRPLYSRLFASLCYLREPAVYGELSLREQQERLYRLTLGDLDDHKTKEASFQAIEESQRHRISFARRLLDLGADPHHSERSYRYTMPVLDMYPSQDTCYRTPLQLAASSGFTKMVKFLLSLGADCNKMGFGPGHNFADPLDLPLVLAVEHSLVEGKGKLDTIKLLLNAGASFADVAGKSVLRCLWIVRCSGYYRKIESDHWIAILKLLMKHGAADQTSESQWAEIVRHACTPDNLPVCKLLVASRTISTFSPVTMAKMVQQAAVGFGFVSKADPEDTDLVAWVLSHCVRPDGTLIVGRPQLVLNASLADLKGRPMVAKVLRDFIAIHG